MTPHLWASEAVFPHFLGWNLCMTSLIVLYLDDRELLIVDSFKSTKNINKGFKVRQPIYKSL